MIIAAVCIITTWLSRQKHLILLHAVQVHAPTVLFIPFLRDRPHRTCTCIGEVHASCIDDEYDEDDYDDYDEEDDDLYEPNIPVSPCHNYGPHNDTYHSGGTPFKRLMTE